MHSLEHTSPLLSDNCKSKNRQIWNSLLRSCSVGSDAANAGTEVTSIAMMSTAYVQLSSKVPKLFNTHERNGCVQTVKGQVSRSTTGATSGGNHSVPMHLHAAEHLHTPVLHMPQDGTRKAADTQRQADTQSQNIRCLGKFATPSDSVNSEQSMI